MKFCDAIDSKKHVYDDTIFRECPFCKAPATPVMEIKPIPFEPSPALDELLGTVKAVKEEIAAATGMPADTPPLCTACHHIATSYDKDFNKFRCLHPDNYAGINVVDGSKVYLFPLCTELRNQQNRHPQACCNYLGKGFKKAEQRPVYNVEYVPPNVTPIGPRKVKITDDDLNNL